LILEEYLSANSNLYNTPWPRISGHSICSYHISQQNIKYKYTIFEDKVHFCLIRDIQVNSESNILKQCDLLTTKNKLTDAINLLLDYQKNTPSANVYMEDLRNSLCVFPFFVMAWFNSEDSDKLIDSTFPIRFMKNLLKYYNYYL
tara:strand:+ start:159 stop:593 length:435 start_codon:yes stop_codon:yes gene_type:complete